MKPHQNIPLERTRILLFDAEAGSSSVVAPILHALNIRASVRRTSFRSAQEALLAQPFDLVMVDAPLALAIEFARWLRADGSDNRERPTALVTGRTGPEEVKSARDAGFNIVIAKPFTQKSLAERLGWLLGHKREFVQAGSYTGPDRRFRDGGTAPVRRRESDRVPLWPD